VRTVGCFTDGHGRGRASGVFRLDVRRWVGFAGASATALMACWPSVTRARRRVPRVRWECRARCHSPSGRLGAGPRCTGATSPCRRLAVPAPSSVAIAPRAALLGLTWPARVPAGERANVPEIYLCRRRVPWRVDSTFAAGLGVHLRAPDRCPAARSGRPGGGDSL